MGGGHSKEEQLYQAVQHANHTTVKSLRRDGTSLEWTDKDGRTPLIFACTKGELFDMVITLLNLGASIKAFRPGSHGGFPLHHAAKRGLDKTVILLLSRGADPLALNDDGQTPLDMARNRGHVSVVRIIEDRICLFNGVLREISGPGFLEALAPQWVTRKIWAVVLPSAQARRIPRHELVIYQSPKVSLPRIIISLSKVQMEEPNFNVVDPVMILTDKSSKTRFKFLSEFEGRRPQLEKFFRACKGIVEPPSSVSSPQQSVSPTRTRCPPVTIIRSNQSSPVRAPTAHSPHAHVSSPPQRPNKRSPSKEAEIPEDVALAMAINASIQSANAEGLVLSPTSSGTGAEDWSYSPPKSNTRRRGPLGRKWSDTTNSSNDSSSSPFWGSPEAGPSRPVSDQAHPPPPPPPPGSRTKVESMGQSRTVNPPPVRNVPVRNPGGPATSVPIEIYVPKHPPPPPPPAVVSSAAVPAAAGTSGRTAAVTSNGGFSMFGTKKKVVNNSNNNGSSGSGSSSSNSGEKNGETEEKASGHCVVCWDAPARGVCIPCGHLAGCMNCLMEIKDKTWGCPVCRTSIQQVVKVFTV